MVIETWGRWVAGAPAMAAMLIGIQAALLVVAAPLWIGVIDRLRWSGLRGHLIASALDAHVASARSALALSRALFRENHASPLERRDRVRRAIAHQAEAGARLERQCAVLGHAVDARTAPAVLAAIALSDAAATVLRDVTTLYLREATVRVGSNVAYGDDQLGFRAGQVVSARYLDELLRLADRLVAEVATSRAALCRSARRMRRGPARAQLDAADEDASALARDIAQFGGKLHAIDPESPEHRSRWRGDMTTRTLDGLIARFNRGGLIRPLQQG